MRNTQLGGKGLLLTWNVIKGCVIEMISRATQDHNLGAQPRQLATGNLQAPEIVSRCHSNNWLCAPFINWKYSVL